jgi:hypothetical protein
MLTHNSSFIQVSTEKVIPIEVPERIARIMRSMVESGVFDIAGGNATLAFDSKGELRSIKRELFVNLPVHNSFDDEKR